MGILEIENKIKLRIILFGNKKLQENFFSSFFNNSKKRKVIEDIDFTYYLYDIFPWYEFIVFKDESTVTIKNYIAQKEKKYIVIIYFCLENDDKDIQLIQEISQLDENYHPFIFFLMSEKKNKNYYETYIKNSRLKFDPFNIY